MKRLLLVLTLAGFAASPALAQDTSSTNSMHGPVVYPTTNNADVPAAPTQVPSPVTAPYLASPPSTSTIPSPQISSSGAPAPATKPEDIDDIRPPLFHLLSWAWLWIVLGVLVLLALIALLWVWLRPQSALTPKTAYDLALEKLEKARGMLNEQNPEPYAVFVSETVRSYLGQRFQTPSTRRTTEEFLRQMQADSTTPLAEHRSLLGGFLEACDLVKFAHYQPTQAELEEVQQRAVTFVTATNPTVAVAQNGSRP